MKTFGWFTKIFLPTRSSSAVFILWRRKNFLFHWMLIIGILMEAFFTPIFGTSNGNFGRRTITTPFGMVRGETIVPASDEDLPAVTKYLGIPYGVAPSGQYRFNMAISAPKWTHQPKDAFKFFPACIQSLPQLSEAEALKTMSTQQFDNLHRIYPFLKPQSEDCLYMNLYVPERFEKRDKTGNDNNLGNGSPLSTLVIVHGGDYGWGIGNAYNVSILAAYGQLVVVTLNYRLGVYGFLGHCESNSCTGNAGLSDLVAALKMLSNILPSFGADPSSLTLLGWGSGAALISLLMASPITQPKSRLFRRAILLDGSALCPWAIVDNPQQYLFKIAQELQCISDNKQKNHRIEDHFQKQISHVIRCLQEHNHQNLTQATRRIHVPTFTPAFAPIIDGQIVPNHPKYSFSPKYGALFRDIDLMIGTVMYPAHHLLSNNDLENGINLTRRDKILRTVVRNLYNFHRTEIFDAIINEYTDWENPKNHPKTIRNNLLTALSDVLFTAPLIQTARMHSTDEIPKMSNTYFFLFAHETRATAWTPAGNDGKSSTHSSSHSGIHGTLSEEHLPFIFGYPLSTQHSQDFGRFTNDDKSISRVLMQYISNFVKSGDPSKPQPPTSRLTAIEERFYGTPWPQFNPATREAYLEISDRPRVKNYYRNAHVGFWNSFVPQLNRNKHSENGMAEEHNFLPDHFNKHSFFGVVRPSSSFHNDPFPPPPLPPTPFPDESLKRLLSSTTPAPGTKSTNEANGTPSNENNRSEIKKAENYNLAITVAVGVGFLMLNLCIYALMIRKCTENKRRSKKCLKYQSYTIGHPSTSEITYGPNSPMGQLPSTPPSLLASINLKTDGIIAPTSPTTTTTITATTKANGEMISSLIMSDGGQKRSSLAQGRNIFQPSTSKLNEKMNIRQNLASITTQPYMVNTSRSQCHSLLLNGELSLTTTAAAASTTTTSMLSSGLSAVNPSVTTLRRMSLREQQQEPLLSANIKPSMLIGTETGIPGHIGSSMGNATLIRPGISPTCPRHGRAAQMMIAAAAAAAVSRANSVGVGCSLNTYGIANSGMAGVSSMAPAIQPTVSSTSPTTTVEEAQV